MRFHSKILGNCLIGFLGLTWILNAFASITVPIYLTSPTGQGKNIGTLLLEDSFCGVLITPSLKGLPPGLHGFHVHQHGSCADNAKAAGEHLDPGKSHKHNGPFAIFGHQGDLPILIVNQDGEATLPLLAPRLTIGGLRGHSFVIHAGSDNFSDYPEKLGGGGARIACGVIKQ